MISITAKRSRVWERTFIALCWASMTLPLALLALLLGDVVIDGAARIDWDFLTGLPSRHGLDAGIWPAIVGSFYLIGLTGLLAIPLGVGTAVYLEEYGAKNRLASIIEINIANLAGVPSVIYGLLGLGLFVRFLNMGASLLAGACTLALLVLPIIIMSTREALRTVPHGLREACYGLGATRWQTIRQVVLPMSLPGILTGAILAISRAIGETAPLILIGAAVSIYFTPSSVSCPFTALPIQIFNWVSMPQEEFLVNAAASIIVLMVVLLAMSSVAIILRNRFQNRSR